MGKKDQATKDAERNRKGEAASNRRLRWMTTGGDDRVKLAAEEMLAEQRKRPGHVDSGGVNDAEAMAERDRQTGVKNTEAGKAIEAVRKKQIEAELGKSQTSADAVENGANAVMPSPPRPTSDNNPADTSLAPAKPPAPAAPGSPTPSTEQGATPPATTPPAPPAGPGNGKPAVPEWQQKRTAALEALRGEFTKQDAANALAKETEPKGVDPKYQDSGLSPEDDAARAAFLEKITNENATENTAAKEDADYLEKAKAVSARATELTKQARENSDQEDYVASALRGEDPPENQILAKSTENKPSPTKEVGRQSDSPAIPQSDGNPILQDLADAGNTFDARWKRDAAVVNSQFKTEGEASKTVTKAIGGGLISSAGSLVGGRTGEWLKGKADAFDQMIDTLTTRRKASSQIVSSNDRPL